MISPDVLPLEVTQLRKSFGKTQALRGLSFRLAPGERLALLGPNGAGKTTLIRTLTRRTRPCEGRIRVFGHGVESQQAQCALGLVPQDIALYGDLTTRENLFAFGKFYGIPRRALRQRIEWALRWTGLEDRANDLVGGFSGGMKRRVNLACGVIHRPKLILLDEPTVGVDPQSRQRIFTMLDELSADGASILLTTHHLDEAEQRSDRIVILDQGSVIANGTFDQLVLQSVGHERILRIRLDRCVSVPIEISSASGDRFTIGNVGKDTIETRVADVTSQLNGVMAAIQGQGYRILDLEINAPSLHHVFLHLTGNQLRD